MFFHLLILFTIIPFVELILLLEAGKLIGVIPTLTIIILTGIIGAALARDQGFLVFKRIRDQLQRGEIPTDALLDGFLILIGALLLLTPGFITDLIGFILLIPFSRSIIRKPLRQYLRKKFSSNSHFTSSSKIFTNDDL